MRESTELERTELDRSELERELGRAMAEFADTVPAPAYQPSAFMTSSRRARRAAWTLAACLAAAAVGTGAVVVSTGGSGSGPVGPSASVVPGPTRVVASPSTPSGPSPSQLARSRALRLLIGSAERYQDPSTRGAVDLAGVRALFPDAARFRRVWGTDGRGVSCGQRADGAASADDAHAAFFRGATPLPLQATFRFSADRRQVVGVDCGDPALPRFDQADEAVLGLLQGQVSEVATRGTNELGCGGAGATTWFADQRGVQADSDRRTWQVSLAGGVPFTASADPALGDTVEFGC